MELTEPQRRALRILRDDEDKYRSAGMTPARLGEQMRLAAGVSRDYLSKKDGVEQGNGRIGGGMAHRLMARGLVAQVRSHPILYRITAAGREALLETGPPEGD